MPSKECYDLWSGMELNLMSRSGPAGPQFDTGFINLLSLRNAVEIYYVKAKTLKFLAFFFEDEC